MIFKATRAVFDRPSLYHCMASVDFVCLFCLFFLLLFCLLGVSTCLLILSACFVCCFACLFYLLVG